MELDYIPENKLDANDFANGDLFYLNGEYRKLQMTLIDGIWEGIKIDEEWLENNDFIKEYNELLEYTEYNHKSGLITVGNYYTNGFGDWYVHVDNEDMDSIGGMEITYVHQLQQFLRLCNLKDIANSFV